MAGAKGDVKLGFWVAIGVVLALLAWHLVGNLGAGVLGKATMYGG